MSVKTVRISEVIDDGGMTTFRIFVLSFCFVVALLDGYDVQSIAAVAPAIMRDLNLSPKDFGIAYGLGSAGVLLGTLAFGTLADLYGRKPVLLICVVTFGLFSLLTAYATNFTELAVYRFLSSVGLGGAVPNMLALAAEFTPKRYRETSIAVLWAALPAGGMVVSFTAAWLLPIYGWGSLFIIGGIIPLLLALLMLLALPESVSFLLLRNEGQRAAAIVRKIDPTLTNVQIANDPHPTSKRSRLPIRKLFDDGHAPITLTLWLMFFMSFCANVSIVAWTANLVVSVGFTQPQASSAFGFYFVGAVIASLVAGPVFHRLGATRVVPVCFLGLALSLGAAGYLLTSSFPVVCAAFITVGVFAGGSNSGVMVLGTLLYPPAIRATGLGWAYAWGRAGSMIGPVLGGMMVGMHWSPIAILSLFRAPAVIAALATISMSLRKRSADVPVASLG